MKGRFREFALPGFAGIFLGLLFIYVLALPQTLVGAQPPGPGYCPDAYDSGGECLGGYCFKRGDGKEECKYWGGRCPGRSCSHF